MACDIASTPPTVKRGHESVDGAIVAGGVSVRVHASILHPPAGGSSPRTTLIVEGERTPSHLLSPREATRLMGLQDFNIPPKNAADAYHAAGDGVAVPVLRFVAANLLEPLLDGVVATHAAA